MKAFYSKPGMISLETVCKKQSKESLYKAINNRFDVNFEVGSIEEFEDDEMRKELTTDDIVEIIKSELS